MKGTVWGKGLAMLALATASCCVMVACSGPDEAQDAHLDDAAVMVEPVDMASTSASTAIHDVVSEMVEPRDVKEPQPYDPDMDETVGSGEVYAAEAAPRNIGGNASDNASASSSSSASPSTSSNTASSNSSSSTNSSNAAPSTSPWEDCRNWGHNWKTHAETIPAKWETVWVQAGFFPTYVLRDYDDFMYGQYQSRDEAEAAAAERGLYVSYVAPHHKNSYKSLISPETTVTHSVCLRCGATQ